MPKSLECRWTHWKTTSGGKMTSKCAECELLGGNYSKIVLLKNFSEQKPSSCFNTTHTCYCTEGKWVEFAESEYDFLHLLCFLSAA